MFEVTRIIYRNDDSDDEILSRVRRTTVKRRCMIDLLSVIMFSVSDRDMDILEVWLTTGDVVFIAGITFDDFRDAIEMERVRIEVINNGTDLDEEEEEEPKPIEEEEQEEVLKEFPVVIEKPKKRSWIDFLKSLFFNNPNNKG
jgi:hypothetical protein